MRFLVLSGLASAFAAAPVAFARDSSNECQGAACTCGQKEVGANCPLHRARTKPAKQDVAWPAFDANTIVTMHGTVTAVERPTLRPGLIGVQLKVQVGQRRVTVHLGPAEFVDAKLSFAEKDTVQFTGSSVTWEGQPVVLATVVTRGDTTVRLRQDDGTLVFPQ
jgi:hypothetical protein